MLKTILLSLPLAATSIGCLKSNGDFVKYFVTVRSKSHTLSHSILLQSQMIATILICSVASTLNKFNNLSKQKQSKLENTDYQ